MTTAQETETIIQQLESMTELELAPICEALVRHCEKNKIEHILRGDAQDEIDELEEKIGNMREANIKFAAENRSYKATLDKIRELI